MKKWLVLLFTLVTIFAFGPFVFANITGDILDQTALDALDEEAEDVPQDNTYINADHDEVSGTLNFHFNQTIFLTLNNSSTQDLEGFDEKGDIKRGYIQWLGVHNLTVDSSTDYVLTCNINTGSSTFSDIYGQYQNGVDSSVAPYNYSFLDPQNKAWVTLSGSSISEKIFKNFTVAKARIVGGESGHNCDTWRQVDTCGPFAKFSATGDERNMATKFEVLATGNQTLGTSGDRYLVDYMLDFVNHSTVLATSVVDEADFELPSGKYSINVQYMVVEQ